MAEVIRMPRLTDTMEHGIILQWYKQIGDQIKVDDPIVEIETDKAAMDLDSYWKGYLLYQGGQNGNEINDGIYHGVEPYFSVKLKHLHYKVYEVNEIYTEIKL